MKTFISIKAVAALLILTTFTVFIAFPVSASYEPVTFETIDTIDCRYEAALLSSEDSETVASTASNSTDSEERFGKKLLYNFTNSDNLIKAYDLIVDGLSQADETIYLSYRGAYIEKAELGTLYTIIMSDYPEYFWIGSSCSIASSTYIIYFKPVYLFTGDDLSAAKLEFDSRIAQMTAGLDGKSDYKISKVLHDRICLNTDYADTERDQSAYGVLVDGAAVCAGYARAYQMLLTSCGIEAWTVTGLSNLPGQDATVDHAWNIVKLDGEWYYTDITWNDQGNTADYVFYTFFNITAEQLLENHIIDENIAPYMPECTATKNNFYKTKGWETDSYNKAICIDALKRGGLVGRIYVTGDPDTFIEDFKANVVDVVVDLEISGTVSYATYKLERGISIIIKGDYTANGDANGDLKTDMKDVLLMRKYLAGMEEATEVSARNADMSANSTVDLADILALRKYLTCY